MSEFRVGYFKSYTDGVVWAFVPVPATPDAGLPFPVEFLAFDASTLGPLPGCVWCIDTTQALVAFDWLLEHGWEWNRERSCVRFRALYDSI